MSKSLGARRPKWKVDSGVGKTLASVGIIGTLPRVCQGVALGWPEKIPPR